MTSKASDLLIRVPLDSEWDQVLKLLETANFENIGGPEMKKFDPEDCFVAIYQHQVVGVAGHQILDNISAKTTLLVIAPDMRGQGIGTKLVNKRLEFLHTQGIKHLYTNCDDPKVMSWNCRHFGYRPTGRVYPKLESYGLEDRDSWSNFRMVLNQDNTDMFPAINGYSDDRLIYDLTKACSDQNLKDTVQAIIKMMRSNAPGNYIPDENAADHVSTEKLSQLLSEKAFVSDLAENRTISNCRAYNLETVDDVIIDKDIAQLRQNLDNLVLQLIKNIFPRNPGLTIENTGHFWYPPGSYMGWHTNLLRPGWRFYINVADEPNQSFFRYFDPHSQESVTLWDKGWDIRFFHITPATPFWHAIYSNTNLFSLGYKVIFD